MKIGVIKETKIPIDRRVAITPEVAKKIITNYPQCEIIVQPSEIRAIKDEEYIALGIPVEDRMQECDLLVGIKEVNINALIANKVYMFFSHTGKKQPHNRLLLQKCSELNITLIDYEYLVDENNVRIIAFGKWAGIVGAYNALYTIGLKYNAYKIKRAYEFYDHNDLFRYIKGLKLPPIKILLTGGGRVANGAIEVFRQVPIKEVYPEDYLLNDYNEPVFCRLDPCYYVKHKNFMPFDFKHFTEHPEEYVSSFMPYILKTDVYIPCHYWDPRSPEFLKPEDYLHPQFKVKVISDISCDIKKPIASTIRASTIEDPIYGYNPHTQQEDDPWKDGNIAVTAIDHLPSELPRSSSEDFANVFYNRVLPEILNGDKNKIIENATILKNGKLTPKFEYLRNYLLGLE
ncbi:MAG: NAD(P)-dependent oxidoreductase [Bacteroidales bacterium]|nr:NAD(P)-dependent oxidoreductase [Bacteroidales bacterium]